MSEIAVRDAAPVAVPEYSQTDPTAPLLAWARAAQAAHQLAEPLCRTAFVPAHFQGKPADATAAILYGAEAGLSPLQALQGVYVIGGKPAMYARTLMAVALSKGHSVWTEELTDSRAIVCGQRKGAQNVEKAVWTIDKAKRAGYTKNAKYQTDPQAMLLARAQADICRRIAPDALLGMAYSVEELEDEQPQQAATVQREPRRTAQRAAPVATPEPPLDEATPEPVEPAAEQETPDPSGVTDKQLRMLQALLSKAGIKDRDDRLRYVSRLIDREIASSKDLTKAEASAVIDLLAKDEPQPEPAEPTFDDDAWLAGAK